MLSFLPTENLAVCELCHMCTDCVPVLLQLDGVVGVSLKWAICHEMGHNLGLSHSNDRKAIMYPSGIGQSEDRLPTDDYNGITSLYRGRNGKVS